MRKAEDAEKKFNHEFEARAKLAGKFELRGTLQRGINPELFVNICSKPFDTNIS
jgi:hypothetical protein